LAFWGVQGLRLPASFSFSLRESLSSLLPCARWVVLDIVSQSQESRTGAGDSQSQLGRR
jgi:hypothetical protein